MSRTSVPGATASPAPSQPTGTAVTPPSSPPLPAKPISMPTADKPAMVQTTGNVSHDGVIREVEDKGPSYAEIKHARKTFVQASHQRHQSFGKSKPEKPTSSKDDLEQEANPATSGAVVEPPLLKSPAHIEPSRELSPPPEHPAPIVPSEADPFEPGGR